MNKKLLTLAVAAAVAAPTAALAEAVLYGKLHVSIDYVDVTNAVGPVYDTVDTVNYVGVDDVDGTVGDVFSADPMVNPDADLIGEVKGGSFVNSTDETVWIEVDGTATAVAPGTIIERDEVEGIDLEGIQLIKTDAAGNPIIDNTGAQNFSGFCISGRSSKGYCQGKDRANRVGVKGSEDLGNGLKAIYQVEFAVQLDDTNGDISSGSDPVAMRNSFLGLAGDWGTFLVGRHDTPMKISTGKLDLFSDTVADYNGTVGFDDLRTDNTVAYISPSFSGFSLALAAVAPGGSTAGEGPSVDSDSFEAYSLAAIYNNGPFFASAAYESISNSWYMDEDTSLGGSGACLTASGQPTASCSFVDNDYSKWRIGLGLLDWNGFTLTAIYEQQDDLPEGQQYTTRGYVDPDGNVTFATSALGAKEQQLWQVQAGYAFGNNMVKAMYGAVDRDRDDTRIFGGTRDTLSLSNIRSDLGGDRETWAVGFDHSFSKRTKAYAIYTDVSDDTSGEVGGNPDWNAFSLGLIHSF
ncbi:porin [Thiohalocapsa sp. ML1]|uniref:porin n=1 Tax=Thiohalocapsa sp. ML1 TaxID=1431688 RepID=UPI000731FBD3|nr:porin [Thiohalocapsa sp. ML1]